MVSCDRCGDPYACRFTLTSMKDKDNPGMEGKRQIDICTKCAISFIVTLLNKLPEHQRFAIVEQFMKGIIL